jgi:hypothetical protein
MIEVSSVIRAYPEMSEGPLGVSSIILKSHWVDSNKIVLLVEGVSVTVVAADLLAAIKNAQNTAKFCI